MAVKKGGSYRIDDKGESIQEAGTKPGSLGDGFRSKNPESKAAAKKAPARKRGGKRS